jgi:arginase
MRDLPGPLHTYPDSALYGANLVLLIAQALVHVRTEVGGWWLHVDLDVLSTGALPAVDYPMSGGLSWQELEVISDAALAAEGVLGWNITIYNPDLDPTRAYSRRIVEYIARSLARQEA